MNYELVMLRGIPYCKKTAQRLQKQCLSTALRSFSSSQAKGGTLGQMTEVAELARMRDDFLYFLSCVKSALTALPDSFRALLVEIYIKTQAKNTFAKPTACPCPPCTENSPEQDSVSKASWNFWVATSSGLKTPTATPIGCESCWTSNTTALALHCDCAMPSL